MLAEIGTGQLLWTITWFFLWTIWLYLLVVVFADIVRSRDLSGWAKALWTILILVLPFLGVLVFLVVRGTTMSERRDERSESIDAAPGHPGPDAPPTPSIAAELAHLADLRDRGVITEDDFQVAKAKVLGPT